MFERKKFKLSSESVISMSAIVIAVASISISVWQGLETKKHNRLSVRPNLEIYFTRGSESTGFLLINTGLGPAMIKDNAIWCDGVERRDLSANDLPEILEMTDVTMSFGPTGRGASLQAGEQRDLIMFRNESLEEMKFSWKNIPGRISYKIKYESMYGEIFELSSLKK